MNEPLIKKFNVEEKEIVVLDNVFTYKERAGFYDYITNSLFSLKGYDTNLLDHVGEHNIISFYSESDLLNLKFNTSKKYKEIIDPLLIGYNIAKVRVNLSTLNDKNRFHIDGNGPKRLKTLIYYPNMKWDIEWGGLTLFANENCNDILHCVAYVPGRVVIFDGSIPHCICPPTNLASSYRLSFVIQFERLLENEN